MDLAVVARVGVSGHRLLLNDLWEERLAHEHIYWDQASVLVQIGVLDPSGLPVAGAQTTRKVSIRACPRTS